MKRTIKTGLFLLFLFVLLIDSGAAVPDAFGRVMVVDNGRIMPLDSYARILLRRFSGRQSLPGRSATDWLAGVLFHPEAMVDDAVFLIDHPEVFNALGLVGEKRERLSFRNLEPVLPRLSQLARSAYIQESARPSLVEAGLIQLYKHVHQFVTLRDSFVWLLPHEDFRVTTVENRDLLGMSEITDVLAFADLYPHRLLLQELQPEKELAAQQELKDLARRFRAWQAVLDRSGLPLLPGAHADDAWLPLNAALNEEHPFHAGLDHWRQALSAYRDGRQTAFDEHIQAFNRLVASHPVAASAQSRVRVEAFYNHLDAFFWSRVMYGGALVLLLLSFLFSPFALRRASLLLILIGFTIQTLGLVLRFLITFRSPVTNLYETFVFVAWAAVLLGLFLGLRRHLPLCLTSSGASGLVFLLIAARFGSGDTLGQLVAVLNSNWWLSVHVITITAGYAGCVVAGIIGHVYIVQSLSGKQAKGSLDHIQRTLYATLIFGLLFTFVGTVMGGIWADQSWGRFWGWDPKENGALVIILWVAIILHARLARLIGPFGVAAGAVGAIIMVVLAWLGVNLLGVGMHSYGFTSGIARGLIVYVVLEILFLLLAAQVTFFKRRTS